MSKAEERRERMLEITKELTAMKSEEEKSFAFTCMMAYMEGKEAGKAAARAELKETA